jgi:2-polyprenyl-6-methoxyphenol hydroxylase-like FAD-dependent oxidoreductase
MSPFKGQGANQALMDAVSLIRSLKLRKETSDSEMRRVLQHFAAEMLPRSAQKVLGSRAGVLFYHTPEAIQKESLWKFLGIVSEEQRQRMKERVDAVVVAKKQT